MKKHKIKKSLARCLTILLIFSLFVPVLSAFSSVPSFAEETSAPSSPSYDEVIKYTKIETSSVSFNTEKGCPFWDGNLNLPDNSEHERVLFSDKTKSWIYVNGELATFAPAHTGFNSAGGVYFAILGAGVNIKSGESVTITVATQTASGNYYGEETTTAPSDLIGYDSSYVKLMGTRSATITVRGEEVAAKYAVGETVNVRFHDDDKNREFTVNSNDGNEVVFGCSDFTSTSRTIAEVGYGTDKGFAVLVNENIPANQLSATDSDKVNGYYQKAPGDTNGNNMRFLFTADEETLSAGEDNGTALFQTGTATISFMKGDSKVKRLEMGLSEFTYFRSVFADGDLYEAEDGEAVFGIVISNVPVFAWTDIKIEILSSDGSIEYSGTASKSIAEAVAMGEYVWLDGEMNIQAIGGTADAPVSGDKINRPGNTEGVHNLFNKTVAKFGAGGSEGNEGNITVTWNYDDAKTVSLYAIYTGNDSRGNDYNRNPLSWVLYGSVDGKEYVVIDTVKDPALPNEGGQGKYYEVDEPTAYQYYKIEFVTNSGEYFQLGEIKMLKTATSSQYSFNDMIAPPAVISSTPEVSSTTEGLAQLFDGNPNTKLGYYSAVPKFEIFWSYDEAVKVTGYSLTTGNDSTYHGRNPESWILYGSNDGLDYEPIDKVSVSHNFSNEMYIYGIDNPGSYQYYKIEFSVNNHAFQMADIALYNGNA